ncbi:MAG: hypothetical protein IT367_18975 [Candidatus Hydrogenedentes bacterium]|nr:hypothetical protein [Candidatus Hydrogenedentota bacterium]
MFIRNVRLVAFVGLSLGLLFVAKSQSASQIEVSNTAEGWTAVLEKARIWYEKIDAAQQGGTDLEKEIITPAKGTRIRVDQSVVDWHLQTLTAAVQSSSPDSWEVVYQCMLNLINIRVKDERTVLQNLCREILLKKQLPSDCKETVHADAMSFALSPFVTSEDPEDKQFAMSAENASFWKERLKGKRCDYINGGVFAEKSDQETFILNMRWKVAKNFAGHDEETAIRFTKSILARQDENPKYLELVQKAHDRTMQRKAAGGGLLPDEIEMLRNI